MFYKHKLGDLLVDHECDPVEWVEVSFVADPDEHLQLEEQIEESAKTERVGMNAEEEVS